MIDAEFDYQARYERLDESDKKFVDEYIDLALLDEDGMDEWSDAEKEEHWSATDRYLGRRTTYPEHRDFVGQETERLAYDMACEASEILIPKMLEDHETDQATLNKSFDIYQNLSESDFSESEGSFFELRDLYRAGLTLALQEGDKDQEEEWRSKWRLPSRGKKAPEVMENDPERHARINALVGINDNPGSVQILQTIVEQARVEEYLEPDDDITTDELLGLLLEIKATEPSDRYDIVLRPYGDSLLYDTLEGFSDRSVATDMRDVIQSLRKNDQPLDEAATFNLAVDIGSGPGNTTAVMQSDHGIVSDKVILIDSHPGMIDEANSKGLRNAEAIVGSALDLPLESGSVDLAYSQGLTFHLDEEQIDKYFAEAARVLEPGGAYVDAYSNTIEAQIKTWKSVLKDVVVDTVTNRIHENGSGIEEQEEAARRHGFNLHAFPFRGKVVRVFIKDGYLKGRGLPYHDGHGVAQIYSIEQDD